MPRKPNFALKSAPSHGKKATTEGNLELDTIEQVSPEIDRVTLGGAFQAGIKPTIPMNKSNILALQRSLGNQAVMRLMRSKPASQESSITAPKVARLRVATSHAQVSRVRGKGVIQRFVKPKASFGQYRLKRSLEKAVRNNKEYTDGLVAGTALFNNHQAYFFNLMKYKLEKHKSNETIYKRYLNSTPFISVIKTAFDLQDAYIIKAYAGVIGFLVSTDKPYLLAQATKAPKFFLDNVIIPLRAHPDKGSNFMDLIMDRQADLSSKTVGVVQKTESEQIRATLRAQLGDEWVAFAKTVPVLALAENAAEKFETAKQGGAGDPSAEEIVDEIFRAFRSNEGINIGYFTSSKNSIQDIEQNDPAAGPQVVGSLNGAPAKLRTQCDDLMKILRDALRAFPNLNIKYGIEIEPQALLTQPLNTLPGGMIPKTFTGNVRKDVNGTKTMTNQIFFTGVRGALPNSHTWLVIDFGTKKKAYDIVLGTKGDEVAASKDAAFVEGPVGEWKNGSRVIKEAGKLGDNPMGFPTLYEMTDVVQPVTPPRRFRSHTR